MEFLAFVRDLRHPRGLQPEPPNVIACLAWTSYGHIGRGVCTRSKNIQQSRLIPSKLLAHSLSFLPLRSPCQAQNPSALVFSLISLATTKTPHQLPCDPRRLPGSMLPNRPCLQVRRPRPAISDHPKVAVVSCQVRRPIPHRHYHAHANRALNCTTSNMATSSTLTQISSMNLIPTSSISFSTELCRQKLMGADTTTAT